jgi:outer membrane protein assembly factor BamB
MVAGNVRQAREHTRRKGLYGRVSADSFDGRHLPYVDNLVNLIVATGDCQVASDEIARVLAPGGVSLTLDSPLSNLDSFRKPSPEEIDEWTHYLHDATNNAVAEDKIVGPPKHFQWIGSPDYLRHHDHMSGLSAMVSSRGRLFYIMDLGPRWSVQMPPQWTLIARDAFNGTVLWQRPIDRWHAHLWPLKKGPARLMRRLVAQEDTVYVTQSVGAAVSAVRAATGDDVRTFAGTEGTEEIIVCDGVLYAVVNPELDAYQDLPRESVDLVRAAGRDWKWNERPRRIMAFQADTGRVLWSHVSRVAPVTLAAASGRVYFHDGDRVVCLDARTGRNVWASQPIPRWKPMHVLFGPTLVVYQDVVLFAGGEKMDPLRGGNDTMTALSADTGKVLWTAPHPPSGYASAEDLLVIDGLVWSGVTTNRRDSGVFTGRDPRTGEVKIEFPPDDWPHMPHHRCYRAKATCNYILTSRTGIEFVDFRKEHWTVHHWVRGSCNYGIMPCNGLVYSPPHSCACYPVAKLTGLNALAAGRRMKDEGRSTKEEGQRAKDKGQRGAGGGRLELGPAYDEVISNQSSVIREEGADSVITDHRSRITDDWPTYRGDAARSGATDAPVPAELTCRWQAEIGGKLSSLVVAGGRAFVAAVDRHTIHALDAESGEALWTFTAGARVDSPPTVWQGLVLFGSTDGFVYCLQANDGALAWRFRAAPVDHRLAAHEQLESVWPVNGSVLVRDGIVYCVAGRSMWLDGGLRFLRLDARTGRKISETVLDDKYPGTEDNLQRSIRWPNLPVALPDVLSCDGRHIYMRSQPFDFEGKRTAVITARDATQQRGETTHLFSPTGFLDDSWWHRTYWIYGRSFVGGAGGWYLAGYQAPAGRILVFDDEKIYGFGRVPMRQTGTPNAYHLFACDKQPELIPQGGARKRGASAYGPVVPSRLRYDWSHAVPLLVRAMVATDETLFVAGPPALVDEAEVYGMYGEEKVQAKMAEHVAAFEGRRGGVLMAVSKKDGSKRTAFKLASAPVFDAMAAAGGRLFLSTLDGRVLCLAPGPGAPLEPAPDVAPGPVPVLTAGFYGTNSHPDFEHLSAMRITTSDLAYRMRTGPGGVGFALKKLARPATRRVDFRVKVRPTPGAAAPDTPGNGFIAFGDAPEDSRLVKCGFRIAGGRLYIVQGPLAQGQGASRPLKVKANEVTEVHVVVDLETQRVTVTTEGETVAAPLNRKLDAVTWFGYCVASVTSDFSKIEVSGD